MTIMTISKFTYYESVSLSGIILEKMKKVLGVLRKHLVHKEKAEQLLLERMFKVTRSGPIFLTFISLEREIAIG